MTSRDQTADWLEWSGLPAHLNSLRAGAWSVFKKIVELDCRRNRTPDVVEISIDELAERCGLETEKTAKILELLRKKKYVACFLPDNTEETGLYQIRAPLATPLAAEEVSRRTTDPLLRDPSGYRYLKKLEEQAVDEKKVQKVIDLYLNTLSQKLNSFIVEEIQLLAERFPLEAIERTIERAARYEVRSIAWVAKELVRDAAKPKKKPPR